VAYYTSISFNAITISGEGMERILTPGEDCNLYVNLYTCKKNWQFINLNVF
jgi:hypothetical protein